MRQLDKQNWSGFIGKPRQKNASQYKSCGFVEMIATSNLNGMSLKVEDGPKCDLSDGLVPAEPHRSGTVEIRTYTTRVQIRWVKIHSQLREAWFKTWVKARVAEEFAW